MGMEVVDHNHDNGQIRGLLCSRCNRALGFLGEDLRNILCLAEYVFNTQVG